MKTILKTILFLLLSLSINAQETYENPISLPYDNYGTGDPSTFKWMGKYYLISSGSDLDRGLNIWQSEDMVNWTHMGKIANIDGGKAMWAPEMIYYEGTFYLYTCYDLGGANFNIQGYKYELPLDEHAKTPIGEFVKFSDDMVPGQSMDLDPSPFRDDNGDFYLFFSSQTEGIKYRKLANPEESLSTGIVALGACKTNVTTEWTEGSTVHKIDGSYYMTFCGNDVLDPNYTISKAKGSTLASLSKTENNFIKQTTGDWTGTGHNHWILGPDMQTYYTTYHVKRGDTKSGVGNPLYRRMMLDKIEINASGTMTTTAPNFNEQPVPSLPDWSDDFNRSTIGDEWASSSFDAGTNHGLWGNLLMWQDSKGQGGANGNWYAKTLSSQTTASDYVAEFNLKLIDVGDDAVNFWPKIGVCVSQETVGGDDENNWLWVFLNAKNNSIETRMAINGTGDWGYDAVALPGTDFHKWHTIRVKKVGSKVEIYFDNMLKITKTNVNLGGGHFGFVTENAKGDFGWVGFSNIN